MLLRASLLNKGNPFARYARSRIMARADYTEKELSALVAPRVDTDGKWAGEMPEDYLQYTDFVADQTGSSHPGWTPGIMFGSMGAMIVGIFSLNTYYQSNPEIAGKRPYIRKQFPYNGLYLERGGDPSKLHLLPAITSEVSDPYPYYGANSIDAKAKHHKSPEASSHH